GMAFGFGQYFIAVFTLALVLVTLILLAAIESRINKKEARKKLRFTFNLATYTIDQLEQDLSSLKIAFKRSHLSRVNSDMTLEYKVELHQRDYRKILEFFLKKEEIRHFSELDLEIEG
ncbi:MAG: hypothetical protein JWQ96_2865, partial [Segetibacter sp.]|nr:hypothetical protein [Segetibacter sp.]